MIGVEGSIDIIRIVLRIHALLCFQILCIRCCRCLTVHHIGNDTGLVGKSKIKHAVHAALIIFGIGILIRPAFTHQIILRIFAMNIIREPA